MQQRGSPAPVATQRQRATACINRGCSDACPMSALLPIADIGTQSRNVRFGPKADIGDPLHSQRASRHGKQAVAVSGTPKSVIIAVSCMVTLAAT
jgi:hypothetical protein